MDITLTQNQVVWAKLSGFPWWPAYIKRIVSKELFEVEYFGEFERNYFDNSRIKPFNELASKVNRKNPRLMESFKQAMRIITNETTVEKEREEYFLKKSQFENKSVHLSKSLLLNDPSTNYSSIVTQQVLNHGSIVEPESLPETRIFVDETLFSNFPKLNKKIKKTNQNSKIIKRKKTTLKFEMERFESLKPLKYVQSQSKETDQIFFEESEVKKMGKKNLENHFTEKLNPVEELEALLREIKNTIFGNKFKENEVKQKLDEWFAIFQQNESIIELMFDSDIGKELREVVCRVNDLAAKRSDLKSLHLTTLELIQDVREKLVFCFFQAESTDPPRKDLKIIQLPSNIVFKKQSFETIDIGYINKFPHSSNCNIADPSNIENNINFQSLSKPIIEKKENDYRIANEDIVFKVCKKIAKLLYIELSVRRTTKADCEATANLIELRIRNSCKSHEEYKRKVVYLMKKLSQKCERFLVSKKGNIIISRDLPINDIVQTFLIKK